MGHIGKSQMVAVVGLITDDNGARIVDYRKGRAKHTPIHIDRAVMERVESQVPLCPHHQGSNMVLTH